METKLERISQLSKENPDMVFTSIGHLINAEMLTDCHRKMDGSKAVGIDGITKDMYEKKSGREHSKPCEKAKEQSIQAKTSQKSRNSKRKWENTTTQHLLL